MVTQLLSEDARCTIPSAIVEGIVPIYDGGVIWMSSLRDAVQFIWILPIMLKDEKSQSRARFCCIRQQGDNITASIISLADMVVAALGDGIRYEFHHAAIQVEELDSSS